MARNVEFNEEAAIQKAMEVFWKKGYSGASLRDLTDAMKINSSSLYNTIGDKQQLFVKCIKYYTDSRMAQAQKRVNSAKTPLKALINFINDAVDTIIKGDNSCMAIKTAFEVALDDKNVQAILKADGDFTHQLLLSLVKDAMAQGQLNEAGDPEVLTDYLISIYTGWYESYIIHRDPVRIKKMAKFLIHQISR